MAISFPDFDNDDLDLDFLDESQIASEIIFSEYFTQIIITSSGQVKFWNGSSYIAKPIKYWNSSTWITKPIKHWNGSAWITGN